MASLLTFSLMPSEMNIHGKYLKRVVADHFSTELVNKPTNPATGKSKEKTTFFI